MTDAEKMNYFIRIVMRAQRYNAERHIEKFENVEYYEGQIELCEYVEKCFKDFDANGFEGLAERMRKES